MVAEHGLQAPGELGGQRNLGDKIQHLLALVEGVLYQVHIDAGLAAAGHSVQQGDGLLPEALVHLVVGTALLLAQDGRV